MGLFGRSYRGRRNQGALIRIPTTEKGRQDLGFCYLAVLPVTTHIRSLNIKSRRPKNSSLKYNSREQWACHCCFNQQATRNVTLLIAACMYSLNTACIESRRGYLVGETFQEGVAN